MSDYTPSVDEARERYIDVCRDTDQCHLCDEVGAEFDRMIAQVRAEALREAYADLQSYTDSGAPFGHRPVEEFLLHRADRIEREAGL